MVRTESLGAGGVFRSTDKTLVQGTSVSGRGQVGRAAQNRSGLTAAVRAAGRHLELHKEIPPGEARTVHHYFGAMCSLVCSTVAYYTVLTTVSSLRVEEQNLTKFQISLSD